MYDTTTRIDGGAPTPVAASRSSRRPLKRGRGAPDRDPPNEPTTNRTKAAAGAAKLAV